MEEVEIFISPFAAQCLQEIYNYYSQVGSDDVAEMVVHNIVEDIEQLRVYPNLGSNEPVLELKKFILVYNFKIIFERKTNVIEILDIFHTAQDPEKLPTRNS
jgi:plasmid stabilization system protein ParE